MQRARPEMDLLVAALRSVLVAEVSAGGAVAPVADPAVDLPSAGAFIAQSKRHRLAPVLAPHATTLGLPPGVAGALEEAGTEARLRAMTALSRTALVAGVLTDAGVDHLMLKGVALAQQTTGDPLARGGGDVDILVDPSDVGAALHALQGAGMCRDPFNCPSPESPLFPYAQRSQKELLVWHGDWQVDLHWRLDNVPGSLSWPLRGLLDQAESFWLGGTTVATLDVAHALVLNAAHGAVDQWTALRAVVDHVRLRRLADEAEVDELAAKSGARRRLVVADAIVEMVLGSGRSPGLGRSKAHVDAIWSGVLAGEEHKGRPTVVSSLRGFQRDLVLHDTWRDRARRLEHLLWPTSAMARRELGSVGDQLPALYCAMSPYFLARRASGKRSSAA